MISDILDIKLVDSSKNGIYIFECKGCIDVKADAILNVLREVPSNSLVQLDFSQVGRVNSMGLSLLLKIFQDWKKSDIQAEVYNLNKMVGMLFKITGLGSYVRSGSPAAEQKTQDESPSRPASPTKPGLASRLRSPIANMRDRRSPSAPPQPTVKPSGTLHFSANIANSFHRSGWYALSTFMQRHLNTAIHFEQCTDISQLSGKPIDLFFGNPFFACRLMQTNDFIPIMRTESDAEQVVVICHSEMDASIHDYSGAQVTAASPNSMALLLGRKLCDKNGLDSADLVYSYSGNEIKAIQNIIKQQADLAFISKQTYDALSSFSRESTNLLLRSDVSFSHPLFCIARRLNGLKDQLIEVLANMDEEQEGRKILEKIQVKKWDRSESEAIEMLNQLYTEYTPK